MKLLAADVLGLLDHLRIERAHLCGSSLGAMVAMSIATSHPNRVDRLVLCNTTAWAGPAQAWISRADAVAEKGMPVLRTSVMERWLSPHFVTCRAERAEEIALMATCSSDHGYIGACHAIGAMDQRQSIRLIRNPTLVIASTADIATPPADSRMIAQAIGGALYKELPGGHLSHVEQPQALAEELKNFLNH
jgi:3-oxoadipate enol-lactonase